MKRWVIGTGALLLVIVMAAVAALLLVDADRFRPQVQQTLGRALGRDVHIGKLHVSIGSGALSADDIHIGDDPAFGSEPFVTARSLSLGVRLWPLLVDRRLSVTSLTLDQPRVRLLQDRKGRWNFASLGGTGAAAAPDQGSAGAPAFDVKHLAIRDGRIDLKQSAGTVHSYREVQVDASDVGLAAAFPLSVSAAMPGGGTLRFDGSVGPWSRANAVMTPLDARLRMHQLDLVGAGLMGSDAGVGGRLDLDTRIRSAAGVLQSDGHIDARQLQLVASGSPAPTPVSIDYRASYRLDRAIGRIEHATLGAGKARLAASGSFDNRPAVMRLDLQMKGKALPVDDLQPLLPAFGVVLPKDSRLDGGAFGADLAVRGPLDALVMAGPVTLENTRLAGYSLGAKLGGALALAGIAAPRDTVIEHAQAKLTVAPAGITADPASARIAGLGTVSGKGHMAADGRLDFRMLVKLDKAITGGARGGQGVAGLLGGSRAGRVLGGVLGGSSDKGIGVRVTGTASAPAFKVDPTAVAGLLQSGLAAGSAKEAGATAPPAASKADRTHGALDALLRNALAPKRKPAGDSGH